VKVVRTKIELRGALEPFRRGRIALVPTMGAFHEGHLSLLRAARQECNTVVCSLFVNPAQFGQGEDLERYPRSGARDRELARAEGVDFLFAPAPEEMYPPGFETWVSRRGSRSSWKGSSDPRTSAVSPRSASSSSTSSTRISPTSAPRTLSSWP